MTIPINVQTGTTPRNILAREREARAMQLRNEGHSYSAIARDLQVSDVAVAKMIRKVLSRTMTMTQEKAEEVRQIELQRLDELIRAHWQFAMAGDEKSSAIILRCMDRRSAFLGLDAPKKVEVEEVSDIDKQLDQLIARAQQRRASQANGSGQVQAPMEIAGPPQPDDAGGEVVNLARDGGSWVRQDADGGGGCEPLRDQEPRSTYCPDSANVP